MQRKFGVFASSLALAACLGLVLPAQAKTAPHPRRILEVIQNGPFRTGRGFGFHHAVTDHTAQVLQEIGKETGAFTVDVTQDAHATLNATNLRRYDAVVFYTTGELPLTPQEQKDFMNWVKAGHGVVGIHCATDTNYNWPEWHEMLGGTFNDHPWHAGSNLAVINVDPKFPSQRQWPKEFQWTDEFYQFKNWDKNKVHVLLRLDPKKLDMTRPGIKRTDGYFANAWVKYWGKGRIFYTALGHDARSWDDPAFRKQVEMGVRWADGEIPYKVHVP